MLTYVQACTGLPKQMQCTHGHACPKAVWSPGYGHQHARATHIGARTVMHIESQTHTRTHKEADPHRTTDRDTDTHNKTHTAQEQQNTYTRAHRHNNLVEVLCQPHSLLLVPPGVLTGLAGGRHTNVHRHAPIHMHMNIITYGVVPRLADVLIYHDVPGMLHRDTRAWTHRHVITVLAECLRAWG